MRVALSQMTSVPDLNLNIKTIQDNINIAKNNGAEFILFPENCGFMGKGTEMLSNAYEESMNTVLIAAREAANANSIFVLLGSIAVFPSKVNTVKLANSSLFIDRQGNIGGRYDKINMFDANISSKESYNESHRYIAGSEIVAVENELGKIGLTICYDIRFPNLYRKLAQAGAEIIVVPAAFTKVTGSAHWHILNRSRAIENVSFVIAPCAIGKISGGGESYGHSLIINPWGNIIKDGGQKRGIITSNIDISLVKKYRKQLPSLEHDKDFKIKEFKLKKNYNIFQITNL